MGVAGGAGPLGQLGYPEKGLGDGGGRAGGAVGRRNGGGTRHNIAETERQRYWITWLT